MNIVNRLTLRQLMLNKKRTIVTILGSIVSVAMITAVCTLVTSFMDMMQRLVISDSGEWHVLYKNVDKRQLDAINKDEESKIVILSRDRGYSPLEGSQNPNKPYIFIKEYNKNGFAKFPVKLVEGRIPESPDEIIISQSIISNAKVDLKIGDSITLDIGQRYHIEDGEKLRLSQTDSLSRNENGIAEILTKEFTKTYTIVGIIEQPSWEPTWSPGYTALSYVDESLLGEDETVNASVIVKNLNQKLFKHAENLAQENGINEVSYNHELLRYYGVIKDDSLKNTLFIFSGILMVIIVVGSISLIYNAFAISVADRSRYLGMLSSVGATKKQKRNSVFFEGTVIGSVSIPIGILAGLLGIGVTLFLVNPLIKNILPVTANMRLVVHPATILVTVLISVATIFISSYIPARRASNMSAIDAIRQTKDVKLTKRQVKTSRITRFIFGIEGDLALKNLKRNKGRYKATLFSLIISIVLFLVVSQFTQYLKKTAELTSDGINYDVAIYFEEWNKEKNNIIIDKIKTLDNITKSAKIDILYASSNIDADRAPDFIKEQYDNPNESITYQIYVNALDDASLKAYADEVGIDYEKLKDANSPSAIVIDTVNRRYYTSEGNLKYEESKMINLDIGEKIPLNIYVSEEEPEWELASLNVIALTNKVPVGIFAFSGGANINVIVSEDVFDKFSEDIKNKDIKIPVPLIQSSLFLNSSNPLKLQEDIEAIQNESDNMFHLYNLYFQRQREAQLITLISVFTYGFIALITAICIANIINTISTSIALRKREFAMLRSVGMTPQGFNKMINFESLFYGIKAILFGLPISFAIMYLMHSILDVSFSFGFALPWLEIGIAVVSVFVIVGIAMLYSGAKIKKENIIDVLKQEII